MTANILLAQSTEAPGQNAIPLALLTVLCAAVLVIAALATRTITDRKE